MNTEEGKCRTFEDIVTSAEQVRVQGNALFAITKPGSALCFAASLHDQLLFTFDALLKAYKEQQQLLAATSTAPEVAANADA